MKEIKAVVETVSGDYETEVKSISEFKQIIKQLNDSDDNHMIMIGSIALRAGTIRSIMLQE